MNKEQLLEDVKFPLKWDSDIYKMYIFDSNNEMIADVEYDNIDATKEIHPYEKLIGDFKEVSVSETGQRYFLYQGDYYDQKSGVRIGSVRGWGRFKYKKNPEERQDNIAEYILTIINQGT